MLNLITCEIEENELLKNYGYYQLNQFKPNISRCATWMRSYMVSKEKQLRSINEMENDKHNSM
jgi:hypothetical protein